MTRIKQRVTITVDPELLAAAQRGIADGRADSLSAWISEAIEARIVRDQRLALLGAAIADYEREFGEITAHEIAAQRRADRGDAVVVRGPAKRPGRQKRPA